MPVNFILLTLPENVHGEQGLPVWWGGSWAAGLGIVASEITVRLQGGRDHPDDEGPL